MNALYHALLSYMIAHIAIVFWILVVFVGASLVGSALPTPSSSDSKWYVVFFAFCHGASFNFFRLPWIRSFFGVQENPTTLDGIKAEAGAQKIDPTVQGITQKPPEKP